jgi:hypothetical protein
MKLLLRVKSLQSKPLLMIHPNQMLRRSLQNEWRPRKVEKTPSSQCMEMSNSRMDKLKKIVTLLPFLRSKDVLYLCQDLRKMF